MMDIEGNNLQQPLLTFESSYASCSPNREGDCSFQNGSSVTYKEALSRNPLDHRQNDQNCQFNNIFDSNNLFSTFCDSDDSEALEIDMDSMTTVSTDFETMTTIASDNHNKSVAVDSLQLLQVHHESMEKTSQGDETDVPNCDSTKKPAGCSIDSCNSSVGDQYVQEIELIKEKITRFATEYKVQILVFGCADENSLEMDKKNFVFSHATGLDAIRFHDATNGKEAYSKFCECLSKRSFPTISSPQSTTEDAGCLLTSPRVSDDAIDHIPINKMAAATDRTVKRKRKVKDKTPRNETQVCRVKIRPLTKTELKINGKIEQKQEQKEDILNIENVPETGSEKVVLTSESDLDSFQRFRCKVCDYRTHFKKNLQEHELLHVKPALTCQLCLMAFVEQADLDWHIKFNHKCQQCNQMFSSLSQLKEHEEKHKVEKLVCKVCGKKFARLDTLERHAVTHKGKKPYDCLTCNKSFARLDTLQKHKIVHLGQRPYICDVCGKGLSRPEYLVAHKRIHTGDRPFMCENCGKQCYTAADLTKHNKKCPANNLTQVDLDTVSEQTIPERTEITIDDDILFNVQDITPFAMPDSFIAPNLNMTPTSTPNHANGQLPIYAQQSCEGFIGQSQSLEQGFYSNIDPDGTQLFNSYLQGQMW